MHGMNQYNLLLSTVITGKRIIGTKTSIRDLSVVNARFLVSTNNDNLHYSRQ